jgi:hypothetical protein
MDVKPYKIEVYTAPNGSLPFKEWVDSLRDLKVQATIFLGESTR